MMAATPVRDEPSMEEILASIRKIISEQDAEPVPQKPAAAQTVAVAAPAPAPPPAAAAEVLELTTVLNDDGTITDLASMGEDMLADDFDAMVAEATAQPDEVAAQASVVAALEDVAADLADFSDVPIDFEVGTSEFGEEQTALSDTLETDDAVMMEGLKMSPTPQAISDLSAVAAAAPAATAMAEALAPAVADTAQATILSSQAVDRSLSALSELRNAMHAATQQPSGPSVTLEDLTKELLRPMLKSWLDANLPPLVERLVKEEIRRITGQGV